ncbi:MAG: alpha/beta hydrolase [Pseudomonadota bacterium]
MVKVIGGVITLLALAYALLQLSAFLSVRNAERRYPPIGDFLYVKGYRVHYMVKGSGPPLVLLHGAGGNIRDWTFRLMDQLTDKFTVIAFDRPGHGYTDAMHDNGETLEEQADLLLAACKLLGHRKVFLMGYSFGGTVALSWTINYPRSVQGICLLGAASNNWVLNYSWVYDWAADRTTSWFFSPFVAGLVPNTWIEEDYRGVFSPQKPPHGFFAHAGVPLTVRTRSFRATARQIARLRPQILKMAEQYDQIKVPVEIIHGTHDRSVPIAIHSDILIDQIPHAVYRRLDGFGHGIHQLAVPTIVDSLERLKSNCTIHGTCL